LIETLTCAHGHTFERERVRGRKPKLCPTHRDSPQDNSVRASVAVQDPKPTPKRKRRSKTSYEQLSERTAGVARPDLDDLPLGQRMSGWCTDYDPAPAAQHYKCDGDLGKYRCPCDCHGWS
jgi:hypothetical protein